MKKINITFEIRDAVWPKEDKKLWKMARKGKGWESVKGIGGETNWLTRRAYRSGGYDD